MSEEERKFCKFMPEKYPRICKMDYPLSFSDLTKLKEKYDVKLLYSVMDSMENYKPLLQKNVSAYKTILKWMAKEMERKGGTVEVETEEPEPVKIEDEFVDYFTGRYTVVEQANYIGTDYYWYSSMSPEERRQYCFQLKKMIIQNLKDAGREVIY